MREAGKGPHRIDCRTPPCNLRLVFSASPLDQCNISLSLLCGISYNIISYTIVQTSRPDLRSGRKGGQSCRRHDYWYKESEKKNYCSIHTVRHKKAFDSQNYYIFCIFVGIAHIENIKNTDTIMKKIILAFAALAIAAGMSAQDLATATSTYNSGAEALTMGNKTDALEYFQKALAIAQGLGDEGADVVANCKNAIPSVILSIGKELYNNKDFEGALAKMKEASDKASEYGIEDIKAEVAELIPQVNLTKAMEGANSAFKAKDLAGALAGYKEVMALDSTNAVAALRLGQLLSGSNLEEAEKYLNIAAANGQEENATQLLGTAYLKKAASQLKVGKYADAVSLAEKANEIKANAQALLIAGQASQKLGKDSNAISFFEQYLEAAPSAKNAGAIAFTVGALFQKAGNKSKAVEYYQKVASDPQFGAQAKQLISALSK